MLSMSAWPPAQTLHCTPWVGQMFLLHLCFLNQCLKTRVMVGLWGNGENYMIKQDHLAIQQA